MKGVLTNVYICRFFPQALLFFVGGPKKKGVPLQGIDYRYLDGNHHWSPEPIISSRGTVECNIFAREFGRTIPELFMEDGYLLL